jgi:hypothetical protein
MAEQVTVTTRREASAEKRVTLAYLSAPPGVDTRPLRRAFEAKGVQAFSPDQLDLPGLLSDVLREAMGRADLVVAVVDPTSSSNFVFYEIGYAQGMGKPAFIFLSGDASPSVWISSGTPYFTFDLDNPSAFDFAVQQILAIGRHGPASPPNPAKRSHPIGDRADDLLARLRDEGEGAKERVLGEVVARAIRESGVTSMESGEPDLGVDFVVWSEDLSPWVGNPIAIELRQKLRDGADVSAGVGHLTQAMGRRRIPWGLLIHGRSPLDVGNAIAVPNILSISAEDLVQRLRTMSFGELVRRLRNQRVHGGS